MTETDEVESEGGEVRLGVVEATKHCPDFSEDQAVGFVSPLSFVEGDKLTIMSSVTWLVASNDDYEVGLIPRSCVRYVVDD